MFKFRFGRRGSLMKNKCLHVQDPGLTPASGSNHKLFLDLGAAIFSKGRRLVNYETTQALLTPKSVVISPLTVSE